MTEIHRPYRTYPPIFFDPGVSKEVGAKLAELGKKKALLIFDKGIESTGMSAKIEGYLKDAGLEVVTNNTIKADPPDTSVNEIAEIARDEKVDCIVALGGGSSIDTGKGANVLINNEGGIDGYYGVTAHNPGVFLVAIPTTAGTGSESTAGAVITDTKTDTKKVVAGAATMVSMALVDPELTLGVPAHISAATGFDALAHALDGFISAWANEFTKYQCETGVNLFRRSIKEIVTNGKNLAARQDMMAASATGGLIINGANCSLIHSFAHSLGAVYHAPHGNCCAIFMPAVLEYTADVKPREIRWIADLFEVKYDDNEAPTEIARRTGLVIWKLAREMGLKMITDFEPNQAGMYQIIERAKNDIMTSTTPRPLDDEGAKWIIDRTYEVTKEVEDAGVMS